MATLGKSLAFYLRYAAEMDRLYWQPEINGENIDFTGLEDAENVRKMACAVGEAATTDATDLLLACGERIENYFGSFKTVTVDKPSRLSSVRRWWSWYTRVRVLSNLQADFWCGVRIHDGEKALVPCLMQDSSRAGEELIMAQLGGRAHSRAGDGLVYDRGMVALPPVPIFGRESSESDIDLDPLLTQVVGRFSTITAEDIELIVRNVEADDTPESDKAAE
jgi:hypothetical protein